MERSTALSGIVILCLGVFFLVPMVPIIIPCTKGGDGTFGYRLVGWQSPSNAVFGIGVSTAPGPNDCYLP